MGWFGDVLKGAASSLVGGLPGAALGLGTSVIGSLVSNDMNRSNQALTQAWQEKMNLQQQEWQEGMWNKTNEYNNASNQMQRLMDAGINPNAAAAQVAGTNGAAQLAQQPQIPSGNPIPGVNMDLAGAAMQGMAANKEMNLMDAQQKNIEADTASKLQSVDTGKAQEQLLKDQAMSVQLSNYYSPAKWQEEINVMKAQGADALASAGLKGVEAQISGYTLDHILPLEYKYKLEDINRVIALIGEIHSGTALNYANANKANEEAKESKARQGLIAAQTEGQEISNEQTKAMFPIKFRQELKQLVHMGLTNKELRKRIDSLEIDNDTKKYYNTQLHEAGFNISESDLPAMIKMGLLMQLGISNTSEGQAMNAAKGIIEYGQNQDNKQLLNTVIGIAAQLTGAAVQGKIMGAQIGKGMNNSTPKHFSIPEVGGYSVSGTTTWNR